MDEGGEKMGKIESGRGEMSRNGRIRSREKKRRKMLSDNDDNNELIHRIGLYCSILAKENILMDI